MADDRQGAGTLELVRSFWRDLAYATRTLARDRGFAFICVLSLGIGTGAFVALATFGRAAASPARGIDTTGLVELLVLPEGPLLARAGTAFLEQWSYPDFQALREGTTGLAVTGWSQGPSQVGTATPDGEPPPRVPTLFVSSNYFSTFGVTLARGTGFDPAVDDGPAAGARVVVSHSYWQARLGGDPNVIGSSIVIEGEPHVVVGVTPEPFLGHFHLFLTPNVLIFLPLERHPRLRATPDARYDHEANWVRIHGRLDPGVGLTRANAMVSAVMAGQAERHPATNEFKRGGVEPYFSTGASNRRNVQQILSVMLGLAGTVLLLVCLNISGMMLVRGTRRERELAIRESLGAGRRRLIQYLFFEAGLLALLGSGLSAFVLFGIPAIVGWYLGAPVPVEFDLDLTGIAIASGLCILVSVLFGLLPAMRFSRPSLNPLLKEDASGGGHRTIRIHRVAAMVQIGIAIPFLVTSGVMFDRVRTADLGFETDGLAAARLSVPSAVETRDTGFFIRRVEEHLREATAIRRMSVAEGMPVDFDSRTYRVGRPDSLTFVTSHVTRVGEGFLDTIGTRLIRGRPITDADRIDDAAVAVISEPLATRLFEGTEPLGQPVTIVFSDDRVQDFTVVGVTADFATSQLTTERPQLLLPLTKTVTRPMQVIVRGAPGDEPALTASLENLIRELDVDAVPASEGAFPGIVLGLDLEAKSLQDVFVESMVVAIAGSVVLLLAALGIFGVVGFMVATRRREFAVRMALGSSRLRVFRLLLSDVVRLVIPGVAGGILVASVLIRMIDNVLGTPLSVGPTPLGVMELVIYGAASAVAIGVALVAGLPSARRATSVQPIVALRSE